MDNTITITDEQLDALLHSARIEGYVVLLSRAIEQATCEYGKLNVGQARAISVRNIIITSKKRDPKPVLVNSETNTLEVISNKSDVLPLYASARSIAISFILVAQERLTQGHISMNKLCLSPKHH